jgi:hypothetical protein
MYEILTEEHKIPIGYSTLTRLVRSKGLGVPHKERACHIPDVAGEEMQHDLSEYKIRIGGKKQKLLSSSIYLRYSKMRYVKFYRRFNRFTMKCFFDEALRFWGYCAHVCVIDNTSLAILYGSGSSAVFCPEMIKFADNYGFTWKAHAIGHADRKAGIEKNFDTIGTSLIPGRTFTSLEDLNKQSLEWATVRYAKRPQAKTKLIPVELFEIEKSALVKLPDFIHPPSFPHTRIIDEYGYISFDANYYWVPQTASSRQVNILQYAGHLRIFSGNRELVRYNLAADGVKNEMFVPSGHTNAPRGVPNNRKLGCEQEEKVLREIDPIVASYIDMKNLAQNGVKQRPGFIRKLYRLSRQFGLSLFLKALKRAQEYNVYDIAVIERIAHQMIESERVQTYPEIELDEEYRNRGTYREGEFTNENDIDYDQFNHS